MYNLSNIALGTTFSIDIETRQGASAHDIHEKCGDFNVSAPSTWKDPEKIKAYKEKKRDEIGSKDALFWGTGAVVSIAIVNCKDKKEVAAWTGLDEQKILEAFVAFMKENSVYHLIGMNMKNFDIPFLIGRLMRSKLTVPALLTSSYNLFDIESIFKNSSAGTQSGSLGKLCVCLGLDDKIMSGSEVPKLADEAIMAKSDGDMEQYKKIMKKIREYNIDDATKVADILGMFLGGVTNA